MKLSRIMQLGPTQIVYPGATHTRRAHSLGVFELAKRSLSALASRSGIEAVDASGARGFLVAALCHDLGHFPYAHSLKELPLRDHESLTADVVRGPLSAAVKKAGADPEFVAAVVDQDLPAPGGCSRDALVLFRSMLSGVLDPDKLDYLNRDAWACGVPYGVQDVDFTLQHFGLDPSGRPGVTDRGVMAVEAVLFSKYQMYRAVYWHKSVRAATAMIKKALLCSLDQGILAPEDLYVLDDEQFFMLPDTLTYKPLSLFSQVRDNNMLSCRYEEDFDETHALDKRASSLQGRLGIEEDLWRKLGKTYKSLESYQVIIDIPEPILFESDIPLIQNDGTEIAFNQADTVFSQDAGKVFTKNLRKTRIFTPSYVTQEAILGALEY